MQPGANGCPTVSKRPQLATDVATASHSNFGEFWDIRRVCNGRQVARQADMPSTYPADREHTDQRDRGSRGTATTAAKRSYPWTAKRCQRCVHQGDQAMSTEQISYYQAKLRYETDASDLFAALSAQENLVVIDARSREAFAKEHIPGAINIPHRSLSAETTAHLDKEASYVTYCDGIGCNASTKGAMRMARLGFSVRELLGGLDWWRRDGFATQGENAAVGKAPSCGC